jgi:hypothetical protein
MEWLSNNAFYNWPVFLVMQDSILLMVQYNSPVDLLIESNSISGTMLCSVV